MVKLHTIRRVSTALFIIVMALSQPAVSQSLSNQMDIRVLIDVSGSMKNTDPNNLRIPALQVLTQLLPAGSKAGVWEFADTPKVMVPHGAVNPQWQEQASAAAQHISSVGQFTDIGAALELASFSAQDQAQGRQLHLILLTDGMVDISKDVAKNQQARKALLGPILEQFIDVGARVHTLGLSHKADEVTLSAMAQRTDGLFEVAVNADQLLDIFLKALDNTVTTQQVPVKELEQTFVVQPGVESLIIVVEKNNDENVKLKDGEQRISEQQEAPANQQWQSSSSHDVITIVKPTPGTWTLISDTATLKRVNVEGELQVMLQQSHQNIKVGQRSYIDVQLANEQNELLSAQQLEGFKLEVTMSLADQQAFNQQQVFLADKKTRVHLPVLNETGLYDLVISVTKDKLVRTINRSLRVHPLVAIQQNTTSVPVTQEVAIVVEPTPKLVAQTEVTQVSNETASPQLQALMDPLTEVVVPAVASEPETAATQVANLVQKLKNKEISPGKPTQKETPLTSAEQGNVINENADNSLDGEQSDLLRWRVVGGAALLLLLLLLYLRRTTKATD